MKTKVIVTVRCDLLKKAWVTRNQNWELRAEDVNKEFEALAYRRGTTLRAQMLRMARNGLQVKTLYVSEEFCLKTAKRVVSETLNSIGYEVI